MSKIAKYVGLDVHKSSIVIAVASDGSREAPEHWGELAHDVPRLKRRLAKLGAPSEVQCVYEAGPTGYGLYRRLKDAGYECIVVAPSRTPRGSADRIKTDRRDASRLARFARSGDLTPIAVPDEGAEAMRDLIRARGDAKRALMSSRKQLSSTLLRHDLRWSGKTTWTQKHIEWVRTIELPQPASQCALIDYLSHVERLTERVAHLDNSIATFAPSMERWDLVQALQAMRGIKLLTAASVVSEIGDIRRFSRPGRLMSFLGLTPSESSSGQSVQRGSITKAGNDDVRRLMIEAAWAYRLRPRVSRLLRYRSARIAPGVREIAWKAQKRLHARYCRMLARGKHQNRVIVAVARELVGFIWCIAHEDELILAD